MSFPSVRYYSCRDSAISVLKSPATTPSIYSLNGERFVSVDESDTNNGQRAACRQHICNGSVLKHCLELFSLRLLHGCKIARVSRLLSISRRLCCRACCWWWWLFDDGHHWCHHASSSSLPLCQPYMHAYHEAINNNYHHYYHHDFDCCSI